MYKFKIVVLNRFDFSVRVIDKRLSYNGLKPHEFENQYYDLHNFINSYSQDDDCWVVSIFSKWGKDKGENWLNEGMAEKLSRPQFDIITAKYLKIGLRELGVEA